MSDNSNAKIDYNSIKEGEVDKELNKTVKILIVATEKFTVYIDTNNIIQWHGDTPSTPDFGDILNTTTRLEVYSEFLDDAIKLTLRRQIGEAIARAIETNYSQAKEICALVHDEIKDRRREQAWIWYFSSAYIVSGICFLLMMTGWLLRVCIKTYIGDTAFFVLFCSMAGAIGALISVSTRSQTITLDSQAGKVLHFSEGMARMLVGLFSGGIVTLSIKSGIFLNSLNAEKGALSATLVICLLAGASERFVPSMIKKIDDSTSSN